MRHVTRSMRRIFGRVDELLSVLNYVAEDLREVKNLEWFVREL
ncbi:MAG: hypothetical protein RMJ03_04530 [Nitrososphaerota archaeon]|nr:hypothetical protein [Nitrososphaerota archaeon]